MYTTLALAMAALAAGSPAGSALQARNAGSMWDQCDAADNCERYVRPDNSTGIRFVEGMGPGSDWYRDNVQRFDPAHPSNANTPLLKRQDSVTFNPEMTEPTTIYGTQNPSDIMNVLNDQCASSSCNNGPFFVDATYVINLGEVSTEIGDQTQSMTLQLDPIGSWDASDPAQRGYYIDSLREIMRTTQVSKDVTWINGGADGAIQEGTETIWTGAQYVNMNRFTNGQMNGQLSVRITIVQNADDTCDKILGALGAAVGVVSGIGGGFFGVLGATVC